MNFSMRAAMYRSGRDDQQLSMTTTTNQQKLLRDLLFILPYCCLKTTKLPLRKYVQGLKAYEFKCLIVFETRLQVVNNDRHDALIMETEGKNPFH